LAATTVRYPIYHIGHNSTKIIPNQRAKCIQYSGATAYKKISLLVFLNVKNLQKTTPSMGYIFEFVLSNLIHVVHITVTASNIPFPNINKQFRIQQHNYQSYHRFNAAS